MIKQNSYLSSAYFTHSEDSGKASSVSRKRMACVHGTNRNHLAHDFILNWKTAFGAVIAVTILVCVAVNSKLTVTNRELGKQIEALEQAKKDLEIQRGQEENKWANMLSHGRFDQAMNRHGISMLPARPDQRVALSVDVAHPQRYNAGEWAVARAK